MIQNPNPSSTPPVTSQPVGEYAGFGRRLLAYYFDGGLISIIFWFLFLELQIPFWPLLYLLSFILMLAYYLLFWLSQNGQTPGKRLMAVRIVREDGQKLDAATAMIRIIGYWLATLSFGIGFLWAIFDSKKQGWHDKIAKTVVVKTEGKPRGCLTAFLIALLIIGIFGTMAIFVWTNKDNNAFWKMMEKQPGFRQGTGEISVDRIFEKVNEAREKNGLTKLELESRLCAYAQRRLEQLKNAENFDDHKGFYEDSADQQIWNTYFDKFQFNNERYYHATISFPEEERIVGAWGGGEKYDILKDAELTHACARANDRWLIMIFAGQK